MMELFSRQLLQVQLEPADGTLLSFEDKDTYVSLDGRSFTCNLLISSVNRYNCAGWTPSTSGEFIMAACNGRLWDVF